MTTITIEQARLAYTKANYAFAFHPEDENLFVAFQHYGKLVKIYDGVVEVVKANPQDFINYAHDYMGRFDFTWLKFKA